MKNREVVINACYGGFGLSHAAVMLWAKLAKKKIYGFVGEDGLEITGRKIPYKPRKSQKEPLVISYLTHPTWPEDGEKVNDVYFSPSDIPRDDPHLVKAVKQLKKKANTRYAELKIVKIPADVQWTVEEYDGYKHIAEVHRTWG